MDDIPTHFSYDAEFGIEGGRGGFSGSVLVKNKLRQQIRRGSLPTQG